MTLDPAARAVLETVQALGIPPIDQLSPRDLRAVFAAAAEADPYPGATVAAVDETAVAGVPCLVVRPDGPSRGVLAWYHGGGWVVGSAQESLSVARDLAAKASCTVVDVDYRLAPEAPFPAPVDDAVAVARALVDDPGVVGAEGPVALGGDSAGGNLAAVAALEVEGPVLQLLVYPVTDATMARPSYATQGEGYLLTADWMRWFVRHYLGPRGDPTDPRVSPLLATPEAMARACPAEILTAEHDPLRDEGEDYAAALAAAGCRVHHRRLEGQMHGFFSMSSAIPPAAAAVDQAAAALRHALSAPA
jgi:acetyl esterase